MVETRFIASPTKGSGKKGMVEMRFIASPTKGDDLVVI
jgi:hypothetical protein